MSIDLTVAIRTYNGAKRLPQVLDRLQQQMGTEGIHWEVVVVDNNSQDDTAVIVTEYSQRWRPDATLRYVLEPRQGSSYARDRCIWAAAGELIGFLDDDNLPSENWVAEAVKFGREHPTAGGFGSNIYPLLDSPPPEDFEQIKYLLSVEDRGETPYRYLRKTPRLVPIGAGAVVRKQAWLECVPEQRRLRGRDEASRHMLGTSEDVEVMYCIHNSHWEMWHNPAMQIWHYIPARRFDTAYLLKMARGSGLSVHACWLAQLRPWQRPLVPLLVPAYVAVRAVRLALFYGQNRSTLATDRAKACQLQVKIGRLLSPFVTPLPIGYSNPSPNSAPISFSAFQSSTKTV